MTTRVKNGLSAFLVFTIITVGIVFTKTALDRALNREDTSPHIVGVEAQPRSSQWPKVRAEHLKLHPTCEACGGKTLLQVHHVVSFSVDPSLELEPNNLITLCTQSRFKMNDHFLFGHAGNWKCRNPDVRLDAKKFRSMLEGKLCDEIRSVKEEVP